MKRINKPNGVSSTRARHNIYICDMVIVVSICVDNILLKMVVLTETYGYKGWKIKNTNFINHNGRWLKILYTVTSVTDQMDQVKYVLYLIVAVEWL
jgi:hypothetical protein